MRQECAASVSLPLLHSGKCYGIAMGQRPSQTTRRTCSYTDQARQEQSYNSQNSNQ